MTKYYWIIALGLFLMLILLVALPSKRTGRSALYEGAVKIQRAICLVATLLPALASVIEELPERFKRAWDRERRDSGWVRVEAKEVKSMRSAS